MSSEVLSFNQKVALSLTLSFHLVAIRRVVLKFSNLNNHLAMLTRHWSVKALSLMLGNVLSRICLVTVPTFHWIHVAMSPSMLVKIHSGESLQAEFASQGVFRARPAEVP